MKHRYSISILTASLILTAGLNANLVKASSNIVSQTVNITFPPMRVLYIDAENTIISILSNTPKIADEKVRAFKNGAEIAVSDEIRFQYEKLLPIVDWCNVGWVYERMDPKIEHFETMPLEIETAAEGEITGNSENAVHKVNLGETFISSEDIFDGSTKLNALPLPPHKVNYVIRATIHDTEDDSTEVSIEYLP
jgi:hypothetical protein